MIDFQVRENAALVKRLVPRLKDRDRLGKREISTWQARCTYEKIRP